MTEGCQAKYSSTDLHLRFLSSPFSMRKNSFYITYSHIATSLDMRYEHTVQNMLYYDFPYNHHFVLRCTFSLSINKKTIVFQ